MTGLDLRALIPGLEGMLLLDTVRVRYPDGPPVLDEETGLMVPSPGAVLYEGAGAVFGGGGQQVTEVPVAGQPYVDDPTIRYRLFTPLAAPVPVRDAVVEVLVSVRDAALVGRSWRCTDAGQAASQVVLRITWLDENQTGVS